MDETARDLDAAAAADAVRLLLDTAAIRRLLAACCQTLDDGRFDEWARLYTEDCRFAMMGHRTEGREEMRAVIEPLQTAERRGRHLISEPRINVHGDVANAATDFAFVAAGDKAVKTGRYHDLLRREADGWLVAGREVVFTGDAPVGLQN